MANIEQVNFEGKRVIVRVDFNVPLDENFNITDDTRIRAAMPTINKVINDGGKLILMSHLGRPKKNPDPKYSLKHIVNYLSQVIGKEVAFADDCMKAEDKIAAMQNGDYHVATLFPEGGGYGKFLQGKVVDMFYFPLFEFDWPQWIPFVGGHHFKFA